ncbi:MAG TPA: glycosyltransferase family 4 protein [Candidatus Omnitrophota bacterium]|nr:glycosyltransferase family 4 protein [Candidatus Omnitrophota bacterium]
MKILVLYPHPPEPDGVSMQGHYLIKGLRELGHEVMPCDRGDTLEKIYLYKSFQPDVVIGIGYWGDIPEVVHSPLNHGLKVVPWFNADGWVANYHNTLNNLPLIAATSNWVKQTYIRDGVNGNNIHACPIGYDPKTFYPSHDKENIKKLRQMLGVQDDEVMIFTAGGDVTSKGAQEMFRALAKINDEFPNWKYVLKTYESASASDYGVEEENLIEELGLDSNRIIYLQGKYSPEFMASLLNACDIYAAPSRLEGFGMIQVEAMACGKPVISINVGGPKETIIQGKTGFLVDVESEIKLSSEWAYDWMGFEDKHKVVFDKPKTFAYRANTEQLAEYTLKLMKDRLLREQMGKDAAEHALKNFNYKTTAQRMLDLINEFAIKR